MKLDFDFDQQTNKKNFPVWQIRCRRESFYILITHYYSKLIYLGWLEGIEPSHMRVTVARVNRFTTATI